MTPLLAAALSPVVLFLFYLAYVTLRVARDNGKLGQAPKIVQAIAWSIIYVGLVLDVLFNVTVGSVMFLEFPELKRLTFTARCKKHLEESGRRGDLARWVCFGWLNPFEEHC